MEKFNLSRQRRRKFERGKYSEADLKALIDDAIKYGVRYAVDGMSGTMALVLRDKIGLSKPKTIRAMEEVNTYFNSIQEGYLSVEDVKRTVEEELGITFVENH